MSDDFQFCDNAFDQITCTPCLEQETPSNFHHQILRFHGCIRRDDAKWQTRGGRTRNASNAKRVAKGKKKVVKREDGEVEERGAWEESFYFRSSSPSWFAVIYRLSDLKQHQAPNLRALIYNIRLIESELHRTGKNESLNSDMEFQETQPWWLIPDYSINSSQCDVITSDYSSLKMPFSEYRSKPQKLSFLEDKEKWF
ncbi:unnamed protein product, partial [Nesidiocoris tenuis]